jgi:hypothetical protein
MDMLSVLTSFIHEQSQLPEDECYIKPTKDFNDKQADAHLHKKTLTNVSRL